MIQRLALLTVAFAVLAFGRPAWAWTENRITADDVRVEIDSTGVATIEHRLAVRMNGNERQHAIKLLGVDADAAPLPNSYVVSAAEAHATSLASAIPIKLSLVEALPGPDGAPLELGGRDLQLTIDDDLGILRGHFVFVFRYRTDLKARELLRRDGAMMLVEWRGPNLGVGLDNLRVVFSLPPAPTAPRAVELDDDPDGASSLSDVRRTTDADEVELLRTYAAEGARIVWRVKADPRAVVGLAAPIEVAKAPTSPAVLAHAWMSRTALQLIGTALFIGYGLLVFAKRREVERRISELRATMMPAIPIAEWVRVPAAAGAFVGGLAAQFVFDAPIHGALAIVLATGLAAHGAARPDPAAALRGPGRWLAVSEREALVELPKLRGALLDVGTTWGKLLFLAALSPFISAAAFLSQRAPVMAVLAALDSVVILAIFGTGLRRAMPADLAVEPSPFLRALVLHLRKRKGSQAMRLVPRVRIPAGEVDADELRLLVVPRLPLRGFGSIEVAMTYAVGVGARVAMPEVLLRVVSGSPCDLALAALSKHARITPGRKADERVFALAPRLPTVAMTAEIVAALASRVTDVDAARSAVKLPNLTPEPPSSRVRDEAA